MRFRGWAADCRQGRGVAPSAVSREQCHSEPAGEESRVPRVRSSWSRDSSLAQNDTRRVDRLDESYPLVLLAPKRSRMSLAAVGIGASTSSSRSPFSQSAPSAAFRRASPRDVTSPARMKRSARVMPAASDRGISVVGMLGSSSVRRAAKEGSARRFGCRHGRFAVRQRGDLSGQRLLRLAQGSSLDAVSSAMRDSGRKV